VLSGGAALGAIEVGMLQALFERGIALAHLLIAACFLSHGAFLSLESEVIVWVPATFFAWILAVGAVFFRRPIDRAGRGQQ
jgi:hypothetical protein